MKHRKLSKSNEPNVEVLDKTPLKYSIPPSPKKFVDGKKFAKFQKAIFFTSSIIQRLRKLPSREHYFAPNDSRGWHPKNVQMSPVRPVFFRKLSSPRILPSRTLFTSDESIKVKEIPRNVKETSLDYLSSPIRRSLRISSGPSIEGDDLKLRDPKKPLFSQTKNMFSGSKKANTTRTKRKKSSSGVPNTPLSLPRCPPNYTYFRFSSPDFVDKDSTVFTDPLSTVAKSKKPRRIWK